MHHPRPDEQDSEFRSFAIVPAAGRSVRMGGPKLLLPWGDHTVLDEVLAQWSRSRVTRTLIVAGALADRYSAIAATHHATLLVPRPAPREMIDSLRAGIRQISQQTPRENDAVLIAPADLPLLSAELIDATLQAYDMDHPSIVIPSDGQSRGHPVVMPWAIARQLLQLEPHETLRDLIAGQPQSLCYWHDRRAWADIDSQEDYRRLRPS